MINIYLNVFKKQKNVFKHEQDDLRLLGTPNEKNHIELLFLMQRETHTNTPHTVVVVVVVVFGSDVGDMLPSHLM